MNDTTTATQWNHPIDRQRRLADDRAQRVTLILDELRGHEALIEPARLVSLAMSLRYSLKRIEEVKAKEWQALAEEVMTRD